MRRFFRITTILVCVFTLSLNPGPLEAQVLYGFIVGVVQDATGSVIPGATVLAVNPETRQERTVATDGSGRYSLPNLAAGNYEITVTASSFRSLTRRSVSVYRTAATSYWNGQFSTNYHALQLAINRRAAAGLTLKAAYTYSKVINFTGDDGGVGVMFNWEPAFCRNRALAGYDIPHMLQAGYVYELPFGKGKNMANSGAASVLLGGWQASGTFSAVQGRPFTVTASTGSLDAPGNSQTADQVKPGVEKIGSLAQFYDRTSFAAPTGAARFGTTGRNLLRGPGIVNLDLSLFRNFNLTERYILQFRTGAAHLSNTPHLGNPSNNVNSGSFMQVTSAENDQRTIRFGLRLQF